MENGARVIKGFILSIPESVSRLWHGAGQLESQQLPPPTMNQEEDLVDNSHDEQVKEWQKVLISTCFTSGLEIALHFHQITDSKRDSLHLVYIGVWKLITEAFYTANFWMLYYWIVLATHRKEMSDAAICIVGLKKVRFRFPGYFCRNR
ncbi:hypothetical protein NC651_036300 [Populus alba x Populus x berolinensis]|nr:hypothetical protein NC651_036300 [Populus alba x Populus x berolinensis]